MANVTLILYLKKKSVNSSFFWFDVLVDEKEFLAFTHPEESPHMLDVILKQTLEEKDINKDGSIDFQEYIGDRGISVSIYLLHVGVLAHFQSCQIWTLK
jgi:hypothetical protein